MPCDELAQLAASACTGDAGACAAIEKYVLAQVEVPFAESANPLMAQVRPGCLNAAPTGTQYGYFIQGWEFRFQ